MHVHTCLFPSFGEAGEFLVCFRLQSFDSLFFDDGKEIFVKLKKLEVHFPSNYKIWRFFVHRAVPKLTEQWLVESP